MCAALPSDVRKGQAFPGDVLTFLEATPQNQWRSLIGDN